MKLLLFCRTQKLKVFMESTNKIVSIKKLTFVIICSTFASFELKGHLFAAKFATVTK